MNNTKEQKKGGKQLIYYSRTYRHLQPSPFAALFVLLLVVPSIILFILNMGNLTRFLSDCAVYVLEDVFPGLPLYIRADAFSILGDMYFVEVPTVYPTAAFCLWNFLAVLAMTIFCCVGSRKGKPLAIYCAIMLVVHIVNCIYFLFAENYFPYTAFQYSNLYMKQQIGIWLAFIVMLGGVTALQGRLGLRYKLLTFFTVLVYSFIFGVVRYILFLFILQKFSIIYMALMFFAFGPFFDFVYLVAIYARFMDKLIRLHESQEGRGVWSWS